MHWLFRKGCQFLTGHTNTSVTQHATVRKYMTHMSFHGFCLNIDNTTLSVVIVVSLPTNSLLSITVVSPKLSFK